MVTVTFLVRGVRGRWNIGGGCRTWIQIGRYGQKYPFFFAGIDLMRERVLGPGVPRKRIWCRWGRAVV